ncbi:hypothetical protein HY493_05425 [Candidatus Woesearchaeota archaeon]|nr:hypothetical protein [Candidatus Woesearchaeota archaeon]
MTMEQLFDDSNVTLVLMKERDLAGQTKQVVSQFSGTKRICVFAIAKPAAALARELKSAGIKDEQLYFVDAVSKCAGVKPCSRIDAIEDLTDMSIAYTEALRKGCDAGLLAALAVLFSYVDEETLIKFIAALSQKTRAQNTRLAILTLWDEKTHPVLREAFPFMDKILDLRA